MYYQYIGFFVLNFIGNLGYLVVCVRFSDAYLLTIKNKCQIGKSLRK